jgi:hypothetical protein
MRCFPLFGGLSVVIGVFICCCAVPYLITFTAIAGATPLPALETIVLRLEQAQAVLRTQQQPYTVTREYEFFKGESQEPASRVLVKVDFQPPGMKTFKIEQAQGSGQGERIVRRVLEHEQAAAKDQDSHEISSRNYSFRLIRGDVLQGHPCYVLQLIPKRDEKNSIRGEAWVDAESYLIRHVDGELAKSPSWWVKDVHVTLEYGLMAGIWVQTSMHAVAHVRLLGQHVLLAHDLDCFTSANSQSATARASRKMVGRVAGVPARP